MDKQTIFLSKTPEYDKKCTGGVESAQTTFFPNTTAAADTTVITDFNNECAANLCGVGLQPRIDGGEALLQRGEGEKSSNLCG